MQHQYDGRDKIKKNSTKMEKSEINENNEKIKHKNIISEYLQHKKQKYFIGNRCEICYHSNQYCICNSLPNVFINKDIQFIIYMDCKEVYNAGDDGKLLLSVLSNQSKRFIYGLEDEELIQYTNNIPSENIVVLFPSPIALSFPEWMEQRSASISSSTSTSSTSTSQPYSRPPLTIIVVDAVWRHARRMAHRLLEILPNICHVQLTPEQMSVYARKQSQPDRICTVEATALFLFQYGESEENTDLLVECVKINNLALKQPALRPSKQNKLKKNITLEGKEGEKKSGKVINSSCLKHPAWYFGRIFCEATKEFNPIDMINENTNVEIIE